MGWSIGYDYNWRRDIGYGVPAVCDHPKCSEHIDRGLGYVCGARPYGEDKGCGLFFCGEHQVGSYQRCPRCSAYKPPYKNPKPDTGEWIDHKLTHESWAQWRAENVDEVGALKSARMAKP
jgi:hypothetical protein